MCSLNCTFYVPLKFSVCSWRHPKLACHSQFVASTAHLSKLFSVLHDNHCSLFQKYNHITSNSFITCLTCAVACSKAAFVSFSFSAQPRCRPDSFYWSPETAVAQPPVWSARTTADHSHATVVGWLASIALGRKRRLCGGCDCSCRKCIVIIIIVCEFIRAPCFLLFI